MSNMGDLALALFMERRMLGRDLTDNELKEFTQKYINDKQQARATNTKTDEPRKQQ